MDNKSNIYKSKPEFIKEGFDPFSVQYGGFLKGAPTPKTAYYKVKRREVNAEDTPWFLVDAVDGKLICVDGYAVFYDYFTNECQLVLTSSAEAQMAGVQFGTIPVGVAELNVTSNNVFTLTYKGEEIICDYGVLEYIVNIYE
jgi:hypothetical protein